jgi:hypothetical protein
MMKNLNDKMIGLIEYQSNIKIGKTTTTTTTIYTSCHSIRVLMIGMKDRKPYQYDNNAREIRKMASNIKIINISKFQNFKYYQFRNMVEFGKDRVKGRVSMIISHGLLSTVSEFKLNSETVYWYLYRTIEGASKVYIPDPIAYSLSRPKGRRPRAMTIEPRTEGYIWQRKPTTTPMEPTMRTPRSMLPTW